MKMDNEERGSLYTTLDSYQAGFLRLRGHIPALIEERGKFVFAFKSSEQLKQDLYEYHNGAVVEALKLTNSIKQLKSEIFSRRSNGYDCKDLNPGNHK
jgi:hypothetical protein